MDGFYGAWAAIAIVGTAYVLVALDNMETTVPTVPIAPLLISPELLPPIETLPTSDESLTAATATIAESASASAAVLPVLSEQSLAAVTLTRVDVFGAEVDAQPFILMQTGVVARACH